ncbi:MAG TPA: TrmJ/YjtD family RNA methyltransferase [Armatimonadetes bacterium]|nr:TrmJ/YjtD family RNA methyltransferase [Armatimonadota bacterium]
MGRRRPTYDDRALPVPVPLNLQRIRIILVEPQEPGNIGATARAMKTMGLTGLTLVRPAPFAESKEATYMAHRAGEVLAAAQVTETLEEALKEVHYLVGTTHRRRSRVLPQVVPVREVAARIAVVSQNHTVGVLFGREDRGLPVSVLSRCHLCATIPAASREPSLNLAQAVMVVAYEIFLASLGQPPPLPLDLPTVGEVEYLVQRLVNLLVRLGFRPYVNDPETFRQSVRRVFGRATLERRDIATLHEICQTIEGVLARRTEGTPPQSPSED